MWWIINAEGERVFTVESEQDARKQLNDWYVDYIYVCEQPNYYYEY